MKTSISKLIVLVSSLMISSHLFALTDEEATSKIKVRCLADIKSVAEEFNQPNGKEASEESKKINARVSVLMIENTDKICACVIKRLTDNHALQNLGNDNAGYEASKACTGDILTTALKADQGSASTANETKKP